MIDANRRSSGLRYALMLEPQQGMSYADQLASARRAEANGFDAFFRSDHYASFPGKAGQPTTDAWTVLAGLARETERITLGVLVSPVTFRHPGVFAKVVTTVDEMSGGRIEVGVGTGWNELEHRQLGIPFPPIEERANMLEDQLAILHGLWGEPDGWSFEGITGIRIEGALFRPRPVDVPGRPTTPIGGKRPRIIVGSSGSPRSYRIAARYADEYNLSSASPDRATEVRGKLDEACRAIGRDPETLARSTMAGVLVGRTPCLCLLCGGRACECPDRLSAGAREFDGPAGQQVQHQGAALRHGGAVGRARSVNQPARAMAVEAGVAGERHDHVDLAVGVGVVRPRQVVHVDHVHGTAAQVVGRLDHAPVLDAAAFAGAHPAVGDALPTGGEDVLEQGAVRPGHVIEPGLQRRIQRLAGRQARHVAHQGMELVWRTHQAAPLHCRRSGSP